MKTIYKTLLLVLTFTATIALSTLLWNFIQQQGEKHRAKFLLEMEQRKAITKCVETRFNCKYVGGGVYQTEGGEKYFVENASSCLTFK